MNKFRFLICIFIVASAPSFAQTESNYTPPPMFGTPVVTPQSAPDPIVTPAPQAQPVAQEPIAPKPVQPPYGQEQTTPTIIAPSPAPVPPKPIKSIPTKSASPEELLNHPVTAIPSPNTIDPLMASQIAKSNIPKPKDGEIIDDTGVDPSKVRYPNKNPVAPAKPIVETTPKKNEKTKSKNITTEQQKMPVVTTKKVEELSLAPMANVKISNPKPTDTKDTVVKKAAVPTTPTTSSSKQTLAFVAGASDLTPAHKTSLAGITAGLKAKPSARAQILSYATPTNATGSTSARRVSLTRGLAIRTYLLSQGIDGGRVDVRALGDETGGKGKIDQADIIIME